MTREYVEVDTEYPAYGILRVTYEKVCTAVISQYYQALANLRAQREEQLERFALVVAKSERTDVRANPQLLSSTERDALQQLDQIKLRLGVTTLRIDRDLFVLQGMIA